MLRTGHSVEITDDLASLTGREVWKGVESDAAMKEEIGVPQRRLTRLPQASYDHPDTVTADNSLGYHFMGYVRRIGSQQSSARVDVNNHQSHEGREGAAHAPATGNMACQMPGGYKYVVHTHFPTERGH